MTFVDEAPSSELASALGRSNSCYKGGRLDLVQTLHFWEGPVWVHWFNLRIFRVGRLGPMRLFAQFKLG